jgi:hypothetical protein
MAANGSSDYFDVRISQNSGGNIDFENQDYSCFFMGYKIIE